ncbi:MAG: hypothetical protein H6760_02165 [Candidatus Nomurabacteria bacterium]|nr:MAG: hypothetical protein H6760_02165 [Candidatus Nomurabacteria bacterium]
MEEIPAEKKNKTILVLRIFIWLSPFAVLIWLAGQYTGAFGVVTLRTDFHDSSSIVKVDDPTRLQLTESSSSNKPQYFIDQELRFTVRPSVAFVDIQMRLRFQNQDRPIVFLNPQTRLDIPPVNIPIKSDALDNLTWHVLDNGSVRLWQKEKRFNTIDEFFASDDHPNLALAWYAPGLSQVRNDLSAEVILPEMSGIEVEPSTVDELLSYDEILSTYRPPIPDGQWSVAELTFHLPSLFVNDNRFYFSLRAPSMQSDAGRVNLDWLQTQFTKTPLWSRVLN